MRKTFIILSVMALIAVIVSVISLFSRKQYAITDMDDFFEDYEDDDLD